MPEVFLSLGSNLAPELHLPAALAELAERFGPLRRSSLYVTAPVGAHGEAFHNCVVAFHSTLPLDEIGAILRAIEARHGRTRPAAASVAEVSLDIDLLLYGDAILRNERWQLPRPEIRSRAFVLEPLAEIAPDRRHPETGEPFAELWRHFDRTGLVQCRLGPLPDPGQPLASSAG